MVMIIRKCPFCESTSMPITLYENKHCIVIPDFAPLVAGHVLIVPRKHIYGIARCDDETFSSVLEALSVVTKKYNENFTIFEHGSLCSKNAGSSVSHAHLHILPIKIDLKKTVDSDLRIKSYNLQINELNSFFLKTQPYLFLQNELCRPGAFYCVDELQRQYLRRLVLKCIDDSTDYDWENPHRQIIYKNKYLETLTLWNNA